MEYWYIGSIAARSEMQKNSTEACRATGVYPARALSISRSVFSASACHAMGGRGTHG
jgi:hypothetical protein